MFSVTDQLGGIWDVLGESGQIEGVERRPSRIEYSGNNPLFLIYSWASNTRKKIITLTEDPQELNTIARQYNHTINAGLDEVIIFLPPSLTNHETYITERLLKIALYTCQNNETGFEYTTDKGTYSDFNIKERPNPDIHILYQDLTSR